MKSKKMMIVFAAVAAISFFTLQSLAPPPPPPATSLDFQQHPPIVKNVWVKYVPTATGNNLVMKIKYYDDSRLTPTLKVYVDKTTYTEFKDDGAGHDVTAGDYIYTAHIKENIPVFKQKILDLESKFFANGGVVHFSGHIGDRVTNINRFDITKFDNGDEQEISLYLMDAIDCADDLIKQNSLFITELAVVEDGARTYNLVSNTGNSAGVYTFGNLIKNICYNSQPPYNVSPKEFLKRWLRRWTQPTTINGEVVPARPFVYNFLIAPWLIEAGMVPPTPYNSIPTDPNAWEDIWNLCDEEALLNAAPFKLTAIVNRMDLRANSAYHSAPGRAGETRLIYSLIAPFPLIMSNLNMPSTAAGMPPKASDGFGVTTCEDLLDWEGMNVIFEFGNPQLDRCDVKAFADAWADLSYLTLGSTAYKDALEDILHVVIDAGADPLRTDNNMSCINRIRTSERIFFDAGTCNPTSADEWAESNWEFSQFEIGADHYLEPVPVSNTPRNISNRLFTSPVQLINTTGTTTPYYTNNWNDGDPSSRALVDWIYFQQNRVYLGNHNMQPSYTNNGNTFKLAATAQMDLEAFHIWDLNWGVTTTHFPGISAPHATGQEYAKRLRTQMSINTCQGCHGGENKAVFSQVRPVGYGVPLQYWLATPDNDIGKLDNSSPTTTNPGRHVWNGGDNDVNNTGTPVRNFRIPAGNSHVQRVSAFLTGVRYSGPQGSGTFEDDLVEAFDDATDGNFDDINSLFYVFDPTSNVSYNGGAGSMLQPDAITGFNDLQLRKQRLCQLLNINCIFDINGNSLVLATMSYINLVPTGID